MSARAGIVVTGTEVLTGRVRDRNGPWLSDRLTEVGVDLAHLSICGDRAEDMEAQLRFMADQGVDLIITSGGLGPTADDMTMAVVARFAGRELLLDTEMEARIAEILKPLMERWPDLDPAAVMEANRKQAMLPEGAAQLNPAGTAPGAVVPPRDGEGPTIVVLPGPPRELHSMWHAAVETEEFRQATGAATEYRQQMLRLFGIPESEIALTLIEAEKAVGPGFASVEITTCLRRGEVEVVARWEPSSQGTWDGIAGVIRERHAQDPLLRGRRARRRPGGRPPGRPPPGAGRVLHRRADGGPDHRAARLLGPHGGRGGGLLERGQGRAARSRSRP